MQFINEKNRAPAGVGQFGTRFLQGLAQFLDSGGNGVDLTKLAARMLGDDVGQSRFAAAGRTVEDHRAEPIGLEQTPQQLAGAEKVLLPDEFVQRPRPHACGQRLRLLEIGIMGLAKEVDRLISRSTPRGEVLRTPRVLGCAN